MKILEIVWNFLAFLGFFLKHTYLVHYTLTTTGDLFRSDSLKQEHFRNINIKDQIKQVSEFRTKQYFLNH